MLGLILFIVIVYALYTRYKLHIVNKSANTLSYYADIMQFAIIKAAGPKKAAELITLSLNNDKDPRNQSLWVLLKSRYRIITARWYEGGEELQERMIEEFNAQKTNVDQLYASWKRTDKN